MHMQYKISLPDHNWVVADWHKLIPSIIAGIIIEGGEGNSEAITYSGPTYIAVRSGKHCSSNAETHAADLERVLNLDNFKTLVKREDDEIKPILMITTDGGPKKILVTLES